MRNILLREFTHATSVAAASTPERKRPLPCLAAGAVIVLSLAACTTTDEIIIDRQGVDMSRYNQDLAECQTYASEVNTGGKAAKGAVSGAVVGGLIGAAVGNSRDAQRAAGAGAVTGGARGVRDGDQTEIQVVKRCLIGRGYRVLN